MSWNPPGEPGTALPPPPPAAPTAEWTWPPTPRSDAPVPTRPARITGRGVLAMVLGFGTAVAVLVRTFVDIGRVPAIIGTGAPIARGSGRFLVVAAVLAVAAMLAVASDEVAGLVGGLAAGSIGLLASWLQLGRDEFVAATFVGAVAVGIASLAFAVGAVWSPPARPPMATGPRAMGLVVSGLVLVGGLLPLRSGTAFTDITLPLLLMVTFAAGHRHSLFGTIGLVISRLEFPLYYLVVSPRRNPFDVLHPVLFLGLVLVVLTAILGLAGAGTASRR